MDKKTFSETIKILEANYSEKVSEETSKIYWDILKGYDNEIIKGAVIECVKRLKYFPKISEILEIIEGTKEDEAELAWVCLKERISREGYYSSVSFPEYPAVGAVVENLGGSWCGFIGMLTDKEEKWIKKDFIRIYPIMKKKGTFPHRLVGKFELDNLNAGYTEEFMLKRYGMTLDGKKVDRKLIGGKDGSKLKRLPGDSQQLNKKTQE